MGITHVRVMSSPGGCPGVVLHRYIAPGGRTGLAIRDFGAHIDRVCAAAGIETWLGEVNTRRGRRSLVIERYGKRIVGLRPTTPFRGWSASRSTG